MDKSVDEKYIKIIESIASVAAFQVEGVASLSNEAGEASNVVGYIKKGKNSVSAYFVGGKIVVDINLNAYDNCRVPALAYRVQQKVKEEIEKSTTYKVKQININVVGIVFAE